MKLTLHTPTSALLTTQLGVASREQLLALGWSPGQTEGWVRRGHLEIVHRGVYRIPGGGRPPGQGAMAAVLAIGAGARITGAAVLAHHHVEGVDASAVGLVLVPPPRRPRDAPVPWRRDVAPSRDHAMLGSVPGTSVDRALVELAATWSRRRWLAAFDACRWRRLARTAEVLAAADRLGRRHPGVRHIERLLAAGDLQQESPGERALGSGLRAIGVADADVRWQAQVSPDHRVDALLPRLGVVLEYDGRDVHTDPRDRERDRQRDRELDALGYEVARVRAEDVRDLRRLRARLDRAIAAAALR